MEIKSILFKSINKLHKSKNERIDDNATQLGYA